jgi:hypothetical protein
MIRNIKTGRETLPIARAIITEERMYNSTEELKSPA